MNKSSYLTRTIAEIGLFAALGFVLDELQGIIFSGVFTAGGSIGFAMVAVIIISYRRGWLPGLLTGLIMGGLDLITKSYLINFWQVLLDYLLPYALVSVCGFFKPWFIKEESETKKILILCLSIFVGGMLKFLSHFIVGTIIWAPMGYEWAIENGALYSFAYNLAFTGPSIVLSAALTVAIYKRAPKTLVIPSFPEEPNKRSIRAFDYVINPFGVILGIFLFAFYLTVYIQNYKAADKGYAIKITSNPQAVILMFTGLVLLLTFAFNIYLSIKKRQNYRLTCALLIILTAAHMIYAIAKIMICYLDEWQDPKIFFIWMVISLILNVTFVAIYLMTKEFDQIEQVKETNL